MRLNRSGTRTITGEINWGDISFPVNTSVGTTFDSDVWRVAYRYSPINDGGNELAFLLGAHYTTIKTSMSGSNGNLSQQSASVDFPLPTIGVRGGWVFADRWRLTGFAQLMKVKIGDYDGGLYNGAAAVEWSFLPQAYAGLGYNYYKYTLHVAERARPRGSSTSASTGRALCLHINTPGHSASASASAASRSGPKVPLSPRTPRGRRKVPRHAPSRFAPRARRGAARLPRGRPCAAAASARARARRRAGHRAEAFGLGARVPG